MEQTITGITQEDLLKLLKAEMQKDPNFADKVVSEALESKKVTYKGQMVGGYYVNPFPVATNYAANIIFSIVDGNAVILLARQWNDKSDHKKGMRGAMTLPSGYMAPIPPKGKVLKKDEVLEEKKFQGIQVDTNTENEEVEDTRKRDKSVEDNARREAKEETGIDLKEINFIGLSSVCPEGIDFHTIGGFYSSFVADVHNLAKPGDDVAKLYYTPLNNIRVDLQDTEIRSHMTGKSCGKVIGLEVEEGVNNGEMIINDHYSTMLVAAFYEIISGAGKYPVELRTAVTKELPEILKKVNDDTQQIKKEKAEVNMQQIKQEMSEFLKAKKVDLTKREVETRNCEIQTEEYDQTMGRPIPLHDNIAKGKQ